MPSTRNLGKGLVFKLATIDYSGDITELALEVEEADADVTTFADAAAGGATDYWFRGTAVQSGDTASLHQYLWGANGTSGVAYVYAPFGNATPSATKPHYTGTVAFGRKPNIGGAADETQTFDFEFKTEQAPLKVTV